MKVHNYIERCHYCSFDPTNMNDYCSKHRPKFMEFPEEKKIIENLGQKGNENVQAKEFLGGSNY